MLSLDTLKDIRRIDSQLSTHLCHTVEGSFNAILDCNHSTAFTIKAVVWKRVWVIGIAVWCDIVQVGIAVVQLVSIFVVYKIALWSVA